ncbi:aminotransferase class V-fold PLP-dependent enzyme [Alicyclobacillus ferrooxydans]|uniref:aminotransferase class V-fold PLP-dependent enzyme n=1 Tax=Alicyclobacillus ferrooxydans TaxID=471514 RepID=UPI0006D56897|nr:aminotransferase class V-fold PLP-dependent enzyme [Alicyclobacillus ferrooxydans]
MSISEAWRAECMVDEGIEFLNAGTLGPTLRSAYEAMNKARLEWIRGGPGASLEIRTARGYLNMMEEQDKCRREVARWLGVRPSSIALLGNATDGINAALHSIDWSPGDVILTSDEEHEALRQPLLHLKRRYGIEIETVPFPACEADLAAFPGLVLEHVSPQTKLVALSEVSHVTGISIDMDALISAFSVFPETLLLIDASHAAGTTPDLIKPRVDFYTFPAHKWLFGPIETGVLYVSERVLAEMRGLMSGAPMISVGGARLDDEAGAWRYEYGTRDWSKMIGLSTAIQFRSQWTEAQLVDHYRELGQAFAAAFTQTADPVPNSVVLMGRAPLLSFQTTKSNQISNTLWEQYRIIVKPQEHNIRISLPPWMDVHRAKSLGETIGRVTRETGQGL